MMDPQHIDNLSILNGNIVAKQLLVELRKSLPIADFIHMVVHNDDSWTGIATDETWVSDIYFGENTYQYCELGCTFKNLIDINMKGDYNNLISAWNAPEHIKSVQNHYFCQKDCHYFIYIVKKHKKYCDIYLFMMKTHNDYIKVLSQYDKLEYFFIFLKHEIHSSKELSNLYDQKEKGLIYKNKDPDFCNIYKEFLMSPDRSLNLQLDKFYLNSSDSSFYLTKQEAKCVKYMYLHHKTAKETARILNISYRTVQKHIQNVRDRFENNVFFMIKSVMELEQFL